MISPITFLKYIYKVDCTKRFRHISMTSRNSDDRKKISSATQQVKRMMRVKDPTPTGSN